MLDNQKYTPVLLLIGQSGAGKSKFLSEFLHEHVKGFLPIRKNGQTTKSINIYHLMPNDFDKIIYTIKFAGEREIEDIFRERLSSAIKKIVTVKDNISGNLTNVFNNEDLYTYYKSNRLFDNEIEEKNIFLSEIFNDENKLFDLNCLLNGQRGGIKEEIRDNIFYNFVKNGTEKTLEYMIDHLYKNILSVFSTLEKEGSTCRKEFKLYDFNKKDIRLISEIEPLIKSIEFFVPVSSNYNSILFNETNNGIIFIDTVGTDHSGKDDLDNIFGIYDHKLQYNIDMVTFINDINKFRERKIALKSIFDKIIKDNRLSNFILVNTQFDTKLTKATVFEEIKEIVEEGGKPAIELLKQFHDMENGVAEEAFTNLFSALENSIEEYLRYKGRSSDRPGTILKKMVSKLRVNSVFLMNPETDKKNHSHTINEDDFRLLQEISRYSLKEQVKEYINIVYENYRITCNNKVIYVKSNTVNNLISISDTNKYNEFIDEMVTSFIKEYYKLRYCHYNSTRALSNGFFRKSFTAEMSYFSKSYPNIVLWNIIRNSFRNASEKLSFITKNYELDTTKLNRDNFIFDDIDPLIDEKLYSKFDYINYDKWVWRKLKSKLIELGQYAIPKFIDSNWDMYSIKKIKSIVMDIYGKSSTHEYISELELSDHRWELMGDTIGYQFMICLNKYREDIIGSISYYISSSIKSLDSEVGKEVILIEDDIQKDIENHIFTAGKSKKECIVYTEGESDIYHIKKAWKVLKNTELPFDIYPTRGADNLKNFLTSYPPEHIQQTVIGIFDYDDKGMKAIKNFDNTKDNFIKKRKDKSCFAVILPHSDVNFQNFENCPIEFLYSKKVLENYRLIEKKDIKAINSLRYVVDNKLFYNNTEYEERFDLYYYSISESEISKMEFARTIYNEDVISESAFAEFKLLFEKIECIMNGDIYV